jgi:outer membrane immunogenic protein
MKKLLLATTCLVLASTASMAADMGMPYTKAPMAAPTAFSWTGCYAGAHVGGGSLTTNGTSFLTDTGADDTFGASNANGSGAVAGGQLGCNYQDGNWVVGLEGEGYWSGIRADVANTFFTSGGAFEEKVGLTVKNTNDFTIAARVGMAFDRTLVYGKAGWAWGNYNLNGFDICCGPSGSAFNEPAKVTLNGVMVGAGIEHALTHNWTIKAEYDFIGFGTKSFSTSLCPNGGTCTPSFETVPFSSNKQIVKVGFNYLFGPGH